MNFRPKASTTDATEGLDGPISTQKAVRHTTTDDLIFMGSAGSGAKIGLEGLSMTRRALSVLEEHPFLDTETIRALPYKDVEVLRQKGSLVVPDRETSMEFIDQYFRRIHPSVPMLDEAQFMRVFDRDSTQKLSLFVFQAVLFAASPISNHVTSYGI